VPTTELILKLLLGTFFCEPEVSDLEDLVLDHDVGRLEISMDDAFSDEGQKAVTDLGQHVNAILLIELLFGCHYFGNIAIA